MILQHPQEPGHELGSANLAAETLGEANCKIRVGLSWRNLSAALGTPETTSIPKQWGVVYLGSGIKRPDGPGRPAQPLTWVDKKGAPLSASASKEIPGDLRGLIFLDGTWSQAKTLWWRNAWLLKCRRAILTPTTPSLYGKQRKEPRPECVSTLESIAITLDAISGDKTTADQLINAFKAKLSEKKSNRGA